MADIYDNPDTDFSPVLTTATDPDSPNSSLYWDALRKEIEALVWWAVGLERSTFTSDPSNDANGYAYDTTAGWTDDEHNSHLLWILDGTAVGYIFVIDDTVAASNRIACTGDNLYSYGVRSGDKYMITHNLKNSAGAHTHDDIESANVVLEDNSVHIGKIQHGSIALMTNTEPSELTETSTSYADQLTGVCIYVPADATLLSMRARVKSSSGSVLANVRFRVGSNNSSANNTLSTSYTWLTSIQLDVSALSGWYEFNLQLQTGSATYTAYCQGFTVIWL